MILALLFLILRLLNVINTNYDLLILALLYIGDMIAWKELNVKVLLHH